MPPKFVVLFFQYHLPDEP
ncbi:unnamed protein product [Spirodela intermedia]|uniref:Uncharacterized protein n=1 Tax=Spirodela intermedia TaxID=51605 RepID=A0A7I8IHS5_SPIIN|nr:unnamed protein product [Spirodela intermedia]CAA6656422.1 unnamed protein product [Spirodela intermedia]